jgi:general secretion pathway protein I
MRIPPRFPEGGICGAGRRLGARRAHGGFSVLEVLVAFIIVALVVTALFQLFGGALRNAAGASDWTRAMLVAQSRLALAASTKPLQPANDAGTEPDGRIAWRTSVAPYVPPDANPDLERATESMPTRLYRINVDVNIPGEDGKSRSISLSTVKIGQRNPA